MVKDRDRKWDHEGWWARLQNGHPADCEGKGRATVLPALHGQFVWIEDLERDEDYE